MYSQSKAAFTYLEQHRTFWYHKKYLSILLDTVIWHRSNKHLIFAHNCARNWRQSLFCCCTTSMEQATDGAETAAIDGLVSSWYENIFASFCLRAPRYGLTLWCALGLLVGGAIQVPQLQLHQTHYRSYRGRVLWVKWPNQQCQSTEGR